MMELETPTKKYSICRILPLQGQDQQGQESKEKELEIESSAKRKKKKVVTAAQENHLNLEDGEKKQKDSGKKHKDGKKKHKDGEKKQKDGEKKQKDSGKIQKGSEKKPENVEIRQKDNGKKQKNNGKKQKDGGKKPKGIKKKQLGGEKKQLMKTITGPLKGKARKDNISRWRKLIKTPHRRDKDEPETGVAMESLDAVHECLVGAAIQRLQCTSRASYTSFPPLEMDPLDSGSSINFLTFPDVFITKKRNRPKPYVVPRDRVRLFNV